MINQTQLIRSALVTSRLGFGASRLHYVSSRDRSRLLERSVGLGFRHLDSAPLYGDGVAEEAIGKCFAKRRTDVVIATKAGLFPRTLPLQVAGLAPAVRSIENSIRAHLRAPRRRPPITAAALRTSLQESLRRLRTDYVDLLLLHEPNPDVIPDLSAVFGEMRRIQAEGHALHVGVAGDWRTLEILAKVISLDGFILQTHEAQWPSETPPDISYGALTNGPQTFATRSRLGSDEIARRIANALTRRPNGTLLVSTTKPMHLELIANAAERLN